MYKRQVLLKSSNGGESWSANHTNTPWLYDLSFLNPQEGWIVGGNGYLALTTDSGATWQSVKTNTHAGLFKICFDEDMTVGYIFGGQNVLLKYDPLNTGFKEKYDMNSPSYIELFKNYPNPFNNQTIISYKLNQPGKVSIIIYDIQGRLINSLFQASQSAGIYNITWNGRNNQRLQAPSGIYFIQLSVDDNFQVKKICLIK